MKESRHHYALWLVCFAKQRRNRERMIERPMTVGRGQERKDLLGPVVNRRHDLAPSSRTCFGDYQAQCLRLARSSDIDLGDKPVEIGVKARRAAVAEGADRQLQAVVCGT